MLLRKIHQHLLECGTDEAGRGCLAGPVTAAAIILPDGFSHPLLNDSKKLTERKRDALRPILEQEAVCFGVAHVMMDEIDQLNILHASHLAMHRAIGKMKLTPEFIAVDGNRFKSYGDTPFECVVKGDGKYMHIAAASILAKTYRDDFMKEIHQQYPHYDWINNKGYPTSKHRAALREWGPTPFHRKSFKLLPEQLRLDL